MSRVREPPREAKEGRVVWLQAEASAPGGGGEGGVPPQPCGMPCCPVPCPQSPWGGSIWPDFLPRCQRHSRQIALPGAQGPQAPSGWGRGAGGGLAGDA